ncbi:MAG: hypothetical protein JXQ29_09545 [Planctomycetes bacterium]|nr:hypothetical protein [Planctomycetota bacterium]
MKSHAILLVALAALALVPPAAAQHFSEGYLLSGTSIQLMTDKGTITTLFDNPNVAHGARMDVDNRHVVFAVGDLFRLDPATRAVTTVMAFGFGSDGNVIVDHHGDYLVTGRHPSAGYGLFRVSGTTVTTVITTAQMGLNIFLTAGLHLDIDDGHFMVQGYAGKSAPGHPLLSIAPDGTFQTICVNVSSTSTPNWEFAQDIATGDFYVGVQNYDRTELIQVAKNGMTTVCATSNVDLDMFTVIGADRASAARPRLVHPYRGVLYTTDLHTFATTTMFLNAVSVTPRCVDFYRGRNIQSVRTATGKYTLHLSFPDHPGKSYVAAMGWTGVRPGIRLNDGRRIALNPDALTLATVANQVPALFRPGPGTLDAQGEARGQIDVSFLPPLGLPVHVIAVVLDGPAPGGMALIADPFVMIL